MNIYTSSFPVIARPSFLLHGMLILLWLTAGCTGKSEDQTREIKSRKKEKSGIYFIRTNDCLNCHSIEEKSVGPPYLKVAQKHADDFKTVNQLANKIIEGGGGMWGGGQMTPHPFLKKEDAKTIVRWVLSLDDSTTHKNPMVETPGIMLSQAFKTGPNEKKGGNGLILHAYSLEKLRALHADDFPEIPQNATPEYAGLVQTIHFTEPASFEPLHGDFVLQATGFINIKQKSRYFFKQVRTGKGRVFINGEKVISENDWDQETTIILLPGTYPIRVEYLVEKKKNILSLQWISPEDEYYQVIPEEVFTHQ